MMLRRIVTLSTAVGVLTLAATPAAAFVATYVDNYSPLAGNRNFQGYNVTSDQYFNHFFGESGPMTLNYCNNGNSCAYGNAGTQEPSGRVTAAFVTASLSDVDQGGASSGSGSARADITTGQLGVASTGTYRPVFGMNSGIGQTSFASINDNLHFTVAGADASTRTSVGVRLEIDGTQTRVDPNVGGSVDAYLNLGGLLYPHFEFDRQVFNGPLIVNAGSNYFDTVTVAGTAEHLIMTGYFTLRGAAQDLPFGTFLKASCGGGLTCEYGNTAKVSLLLPAEVTFTSDSGSFLVGANAVPEPATWSLLIAGFGLTGAALRRRRFADAG